MKLKSVYLKNFRCYRDEICIDFGDLTTFIGKNDIGKSTVLEALEIFFNNDLVKIDSDDANVHGDKNIIITCDFCDLPSEIILDSGEVTNLADEYLTISEDTLRIKKVYDCSKSKISPTVYIVAKHPTDEGADNLLSLKEKDLQKIIKDKGLICPLKGNPTMRKAIWDSFKMLNLEKVEIEVSKTQEEGKSIWSKIESYLPSYALFQSDRNSQDSDHEIQNPMKVAIQEAISEVQDELDAVQKRVKEKAEAIAWETQKTLKSLYPELSNELKPKFEPVGNSKWNNLFSISMVTDEGIPLNKHGSGLRRLMLVAFFKAQADRKSKITTENQGNSKKNIIYAIEEPETSQHPNNQLILVNSFKKLSESENCQVIITTHSPGLARELPVESLRFIDRNEKEEPTVGSGVSILPNIIETLGILAEQKKVQIVLCLEGPRDVDTFNALSRLLRTKYPDTIDLEHDERILVFSLGGSSLVHWVQKDYLRKLDVPEVHIYDNDRDDYKKSLDKINSRKNGSWGTTTRKYEIENYLHPEAIKKLYGVIVDTDQKDLPERFKDEFSISRKEDINEKTAKLLLEKVFEKTMTCDLLEERDPDGEIKGWFDKMASMLH